jgi:aspartyl protease family protein
MRYIGFRSFKRLPFSITLAALFMISAGLPGLSPMLQSQAETSYPFTYNLFSLERLDAGSGGHFTTTAQINNSAIEVLVDTGATAVALSFEDAQKAGLQPNTLKFDIPVNTANGTSYAARVMLRKVSIGTVRVTDVEGLVLPKGAFHGTLLGMSFLGRLSSFSVESGTLILKN